MTRIEQIKNNLQLCLDELNEKTLNNKKFNFYKYDKELINQSDIFISVGTRSTGKTTATQRELVLENFLKNDRKFIKLCRVKEELKPDFQQNWWSDIIRNTLNKYDLDINYKSGSYYINTFEEFKNDNNEFSINEFIKSGVEIGIVIPILREQNYKSANYEKFNNIIFDECFLMNENEYRSNEVQKLNSFIATVTRTRKDVHCFLIGNIFSNWNPYFDNFGIDITELKSDNVYAYQCSDFEEPCRILLEYTKPVFKDISDIPRIMRTQGNANNIIGKTYEKPENVLQQTDWLYIALKNNAFNTYYNVECKLEISIDTTKTLKDNIKIKTYYLITDKIHKDLIYIIAENVEREGLEIFVNCNEKYKIDYDIRHRIEQFDIKFLYNKKIIYGDFKTAMDFKKILSN